MEARFGTLSQRTGRASSPSLDSTKKGSFFTREWQQCRATVWKAGTKYNIIVAALLTLIVTGIILFAFQPIFVMNKQEATAEPVEYEYLTDPQLPPPPDTSTYTVSVGSVLMWSAVAAGTTALLTYFTCRKKTPAPPGYGGYTGPPAPSRPAAASY